MNIAKNLSRCIHTQRAPFAAFVLFTCATLGMTYCATTPIDAFLKKQAPGYRSLTPVSARDLRGTHLVDPKKMDPATNRCFRGELDEQAYASFSEYRQDYSGGFEAGGELARDFGPALGLGSIGVGGGRTFNGTIVLGDVEEYRMHNVYFDASGVCAQTDDLLAELRTGEKTFTVLTRALKAGRISATSADGSHLNLQLAVTEFGGKLERSAQDAQTWSGAHIFFAALPQMVRVTLQETKQEVGMRQELRLGRCSASLQAYSVVKKTWNGSINCEGGENFSFRDHPDREWAGAGLPQGGTSYGVKFRASDARPGLFAAHLIQWTAHEVED